MNIVILGPPCAGKGTQAQRLANKHQIAHISPSEIFRPEITRGVPDQAADQIIERELMPDIMIIKLLASRLQNFDCKKGFILDGFPRSLMQAEAMKELGIHFDLVVYLMVPEDAVISRLKGRLIHPSSGRVYHETFNPPIVPDYDDITGERLEKREDDNEQNIRQKLIKFYQHLAPLISYYENKMKTNSSPRFITINGLQSPNIIYDLIMREFMLIPVPKYVPFYQDFGTKNSTGKKIYAKVPEKKEPEKKEQQKACCVLL